MDHCSIESISEVFSVVLVEFLLYIWRRFNGPSNGFNDSWGELVVLFAGPGGHLGLLDRFSLLLNVWVLLVKHWMLLVC